MERAYLFNPDGSYASHGLTWLEEPGGSTSFEITTWGRLTVDDDYLIFQPLDGSEVLIEKDGTAGPSARSSTPLNGVDAGPQRHHWAVQDGGSILLLTDSADREIVYVRDAR